MANNTPEVEMIHPVADDPDSGYDADCYVCLKGRAHSREEHREHLRRSFGAYESQNYGHVGPWDESACMGNRD